MSSYVLFTGASRGLDHLQLPPPEPRGAEILVRVACCTLCRSDLHTHAGRRHEPTPTILGHEIVGRIEAFGPEAARVDARGTPAAVGSRVSWAVAVGCGECFFCASDLPQKCERPFKYGHQRMAAERPLGGGLADYVILVPRTAWFLVPNEIPDGVAAPANCATATAAALMRYGGEVAGRSVLILGGGVLGLAACAMARAAGAAAVLVSDPVPECRERALRFGATHALPAEAAALLAGVREATGGRGADLVLELAGAAATVESSLALARVGGTVVLAGTVAPVGTIWLDPEQVVRRMLTIRGVHNYHPRDLAAALDFLAGPGREYPWESLVVAEFPLAQADEAFAAAHARPGVRVAVVPSRKGPEHDPTMIVDRILQLFRENGHGAYFGESVTETEHALQCAHLAERSGGPPELVAAALLHDIGHLLHGLGEDIAARGIDGRHEEGGAAWLARHFGPPVVDPVRLHVAAKRYLCAVEPEYHGALSGASQRSLDLQGGPMSPEEQRCFEEEPWFRAAVAVRRWDDGAKVPGLAVPEVEHYRDCLAATLLREER